MEVQFKDSILFQDVMRLLGVYLLNGFEDTELVERVPQHSAMMLLPIIN